MRRTLFGANTLVSAIFGPALLTRLTGLGPDDYWRMDAALPGVLQQVLRGSAAPGAAAKRNS